MNDGSTYIIDEKNDNKTLGRPFSNLKDYIHMLQVPTTY